MTLIGSFKTDRKGTAISVAPSTNAELWIKFIKRITLYCCSVKTWIIERGGKTLLGISPKRRRCDIYLAPCNARGGVIETSAFGAHFWLKIVTKIQSDYFIITTNIVTKNYFKKRVKTQMRGRLGLNSMILIECFGPISILPNWPPAYKLSSTDLLWPNFLQDWIIIKIDYTFIPSINKWWIQFSHTIDFMLLLLLLQSTWCMGIL